MSFSAGQIATKVAPSPSQLNKFISGVSVGVEGCYIGCLGVEDGLVNGGHSASSVAVLYGIGTPGLMVGATNNGGPG